MTQVSSGLSGAREPVSDRVRYQNRRASAPFSFFTDISRRRFSAPPPTRNRKRPDSQTDGRAFLIQGQKWRSITVEIVKMVIAEKVEGCRHYGVRSAQVGIDAASCLRILKSGKLTVQLAMRANQCITNWGKKKTQTRSLECSAVQISHHKIMGSSSSGSFRR